MDQVAERLGLRARGTKLLILPSVDRFLVLLHQGKRTLNEVAHRDVSGAKNINIDINVRSLSYKH
jgi:hypothetical protein